MEEENLQEYEGRTATFQYKPGLEGMIVIHSILGEEIEVSSEDLFDFIVECYVRPRLIKCIENTPVKDLLINQLESD